MPNTDFNPRFNASTFKGPFQSNDKLWSVLQEGRQYNPYHISTVAPISLDDAIENERLSMQNFGNTPNFATNRDNDINYNLHDNVGSSRYTDPTGLLGVINNPIQNRAESQINGFDISSMNNDKFSTPTFMSQDSFDDAYNRALGIGSLNNIVKPDIQKVEAPNLQDAIDREQKLTAKEANKPGVGAYVQAGATAIQMGKGMYDAYQQGKQAVDSQYNAIQDYSNVQNNQSLANSWGINNLPQVQHKTELEKFGNFASNAASGAKAGSAFGPVGTFIGAGLGMVSGLIQNGISNNAERKAEEAHANAIKQQTSNFYNQSIANNNRQLRNEMYNVYANGGNMYSVGTELEVDDEAYNELLKQGYKLQIIK